MDKITCRTHLINSLIQKYNFKNYLEIGVRHPYQNFSAINIEHKDGVDPEPQYNSSRGDRGDEINYPVTSDKFFELIKGHDEIKYDIIFIDGLHLMEQVDKDIENSLNHLVDGGVIVMHDCNPIQKIHQREDYAPLYGLWNGTVWKSWAKLRCTRSDLEMFVVNMDHGCGVIKKGKQEVWDKDPVEECIEYEYLDKHRFELLNLIDVKTFRSML